MVTEGSGAPRAVNACLMFLPQLQGKALRTIEGLAGPEGGLHPVQQAMIDHHGSQCGFCTPGITMALTAAQIAGRAEHDDVLAGNLCRCTGYAPILRAALAAEGAAMPGWLATDRAALADLTEGEAAARAFRPKDSDALADWYLAHPDAVLVGGATDVGLWVTKQLCDLGDLAFLSGVEDLRHIERRGEILGIGACVTIEELRAGVSDSHPGFAELLRRFASLQIRNVATIGGNIANGSPIGDTPPALIALGGHAASAARRGDARAAP